MNAHFSPIGAELEIFTGQAAGEAATLAVKDKTSVSNVNIRCLQAKLEKENVMVHFPDSCIPEDRTIVIHGKKLLK